MAKSKWYLRLQLRRSVISDQFEEAPRRGTEVVITVDGAMKQIAPEHAIWTWQRCRTYSLFETSRLTFRLYTYYEYWATNNIRMPLILLTYEIALKLERVPVTWQFLSNNFFEVMLGLRFHLEKMPNIITWKLQRA